MAAKKQIIAVVSVLVLAGLIFAFRTWNAVPNTDPGVLPDGTPRQPSTAPSAKPGHTQIQAPDDPSTKPIEGQIKKALDSKSEITTRIECPPTFQPVPGTTFNCAVRDAHKKGAPINKVKVTIGSDGDFRWTTIG